MRTTGIPPPPLQLLPHPHHSRPSPHCCCDDDDEEEEREREAGRESAVTSRQRHERPQVGGKQAHPAGETVPSPRPPASVRAPRRHENGEVPQTVPLLGFSDPPHPQHHHSAWLLLCFGSVSLRENAVFLSCTHGPSPLLLVQGGGMWWGTTAPCSRTPHGNLHHRSRAAESTTTNTTWWWSWNSSLVVAVLEVARAQEHTHWRQHRLPFRNLSCAAWRRATVPLPPPPPPSRSTRSPPELAVVALCPWEAT